MRLLKRLHTIGLAMLVWTPNSKKVKQRWLHDLHRDECVSWADCHGLCVFYPTFLVNNFRGPNTNTGSHKYRQFEDIGTSVSVFFVQKMSVGIQ